MAKKKSGKKPNRILLSVFSILFGLLLVATMFIPMFSDRESEVAFSAKDILVASGVETLEEVADLSESEAAAYGVMAVEKLGFENVGKKLNAAGYLGLITSILGAVVVVLSVVGLIINLGLLRTLNFFVALLALLAGVVTLICAIIFISTTFEISAGGLGSLSTSMSEYYGLHAASFIYLLVPVAPVVTTALARKK